MDERGTQVHVGGDVVGQLVVGDHNITVWAEQSVVTVVTPTDRPQPVRRAAITLLPRQPALPVGRDRELATLRETVHGGRLVQVFGPPGMGKSTLIRYAAGQFAEPGADAVFLSAADRAVADLLQDVFEACYDVAGYRPSPVELRRLMSGMDIRLLIDDLDVSDDQRDELLDGVPDAAVIFTSVRRSLWADGQAWELGGLALEPALKLLAAALHRPLNDQEQLPAAHLWQAANGSPLLLLRAVASARPGPDGVRMLPRAAELDELLPRIFAGLTEPARELASILAIADSAVSTAVLSRLVAAPTGLTTAVDELTARGVVIVSDRGCQLAPGVAAALPADIVPDLSGLESVAQRLSECSRELSPGQVADHVPLITAVIDATTRLGRPDIGALLAKVTAPSTACSGRLGAWGRILDRGKVAAELAGDRPILAYLTHEDGIRALVTGNRVAAAAAIGAAIALWHELGFTAQAALAQQAQSLVGGVASSLGAASASAGQAATTAARKINAAGHTVEAASKKAGLGLAAKFVIAGTIMVAVACGGYLAVDAVSSGRLGSLPSIIGSKKGVVPTSCPTDAYFGSFVGENNLLEKVGPGSVWCDYEKGRWRLRVGLLPTPQNVSDDPGSQTIQVPGTDSAWVAPPDSSGEVRLIVLNIDYRSMRMEFIGTTEDAVAAARHIIGLA